MLSLSVYAWVLTKHICDVHAPLYKTLDGVVERHIGRRNCWVSPEHRHKLEFRSLIYRAGRRLIIVVPGQITGAIVPDVVVSRILGRWHITKTAF